ncbi:hypothetical protein B0H16DRAFT_1274339, partial [Mycena metata]
FLGMLRNNLLDINVYPDPYRTHCVQRGGVQYLLLHKHTGFRNICEWGGWSSDFSSSSVFRYIILISDNVQLSRENFLDPDRSPQFCYYVCGQSC